jgi:hypothetical protein
LATGGVRIVAKEAPGAIKVVAREFILLVRHSYREKWILKFFRRMK